MLTLEQWQKRARHWAAEHRRCFRHFDTLRGEHVTLLHRLLDPTPERGGPVTEAELRAMLARWEPSGN
jgi:hypothetical protein